MFSQPKTQLVNILLMCVKTHAKAQEGYNISPSLRRKVALILVHPDTISDVILFISQYNQYITVP